MDKSEKRRFRTMRHNLHMFWFKLERKGRGGAPLSPDDADFMVGEIEEAALKVWAIYKERNDAPLWLHRLIQEAEVYRMPALDEPEGKRPELFSYFNY